MAEIPDRNGETESSFAGKGMAFVIIIAVIVIFVFVFMLIRHGADPNDAAPANTANSTANNSQRLP